MKNLFSMKDYSFAEKIAAAIMMFVVVVGQLGIVPGVVNAAQGEVNTVTGSCGTPVNENHYGVGQKLFIKGKNFDPGTYSWDIKPTAGGPNAVAIYSGEVIVDETGEFCFLAVDELTVNDIGGPYKTDVGGLKSDNFSVVGVDLCSNIEGDQYVIPGGSYENNGQCFLDLEVSCSPNFDKIPVGGSVTWTATVSGGEIPYTYSWSGNDGLTGSSDSVVHQYNSEGTYSASVTVDGKTVSCDTDVDVTSEPIVTECNDGEDNDGDENIDLLDLGCSSELDDDESDEPEYGSLTILKSTDNEIGGSTTFDFSGSDPIGDFDLLGNNADYETFPDLLVGSYTITETDQNDWSFDDVTCDTENYDVGDSNVTVEIGADENITCTFSNALDLVDDTTITVIKQTNPDGDQTVFQFNLDGDFFATTTDGIASDAVEVEAGEYVLSEVAVEGWTLSEISCVNELEQVVGSIDDNEMYLTLAEGDDVTCTFTNTQDEPETCNLTIVSDANDFVEQTDGFAELLTFIHTAWTANISGANWIWGTDPVADPVGETIQTFVKQFNVTGTSPDATLEIASDNSYTVELNGSEIASSTDENNHALATQDTVLSVPVVAGFNELKITVRNWPQDGGTAESNPAGLLYKLSIDGEGESCGNEIPYDDEPNICDDESADNYNEVGECTYDEDDDDDSDEISCEFTVDDDSVTDGTEVELTWTTENATDVSINQGIGSVALSGSTDYEINEDTTFVLTASNSETEETVECTVSVDERRRSGGGGGGGSSSNNDDEDEESDSDGEVLGEVLGATTLPGLPNTGSGYTSIVNIALLASIVALAYASRRYIKIA